MGLSEISWAGGSTRRSVGGAGSRCVVRRRVSRVTLEPSCVVLADVGALAVVGVNALVEVVAAEAGEAGAGVTAGAG